MKKWMEIALEEAWKAYDEGEVPVGAVIVQQDTLIWRDHNRNEAMQDPTAHAEILCIRNACRLTGKKYLSDCTLYVTLEPCAMCSGAILASRLPHCVFGADDPEKGCCGSIYDLPADPVFHSIAVTEQSSMADACKEPMTLFFSEKRK